MKSLGARLRRTVGPASPRPAGTGTPPGDSPPPTHADGATKQRARALTAALERLDAARRRRATSTTSEPEPVVARCSTDTAPGRPEGDPLAALAARGLAGEPLSLVEAAPGEYVTTERGPCYVLRARYPLDYVHGRAPLMPWLSRAVAHLEQAADDPRLRGFDPTRSLFLDIEATGLEHGVGTFAFLLGLGWIELGDTDRPAAFVVEQLLLEGPEQEGALLERLVAHVEARPFLVSFNGKSYDLTVLQNRLVLHRFYSQRDVDLKLRPHFDLLHLGRNLYRGLWSDTRLQTLERELLGFVRVDDLPGALVPAAWFHFLRTADARALGEAIRHNHFDVLSMVTLADRLSADALPPDAPGAAPTLARDARALANAARLALRRKDSDLARRFAETALGFGLPARFEAECCEVLATAARRLGARDVQGEALSRWVAVAPDDSRALTAHAVWLERTAKDLPQALAQACRAQRLLPGDGAVDKRVARLRARLERG